MPSQIKVSRFASRAGNPLIKSIEKVEFPESHPLPPVYFFKGDVSEKQEMPQEGLDILRASDITASPPDDQDLQSCREAIAHHYLGDSTLHADVFMCNGGCMALYNVLLTLLPPAPAKTQVILQPELTFPFFNGVQTAKECLKVISYRLDEKKDFAIDLEDVRLKLEQIKDDASLELSFLWVINPSNPQATLLPRENLSGLVALLQDFPREDLSLVPIVSDEIYWNMDFEGQFVSMAQIGKETKQPVVVMTGLDKTLMVPGWNLSWLMLVDPGEQLSPVRHSLHSLQQVLPPAPRFLRQAVPALLQTFGTAFLRTHVLPSVRQTGLRVKEMIDKDALLSSRLEVQMPQGVIYMLLLVKGVESDEALLRRLLQEQNAGCFPCHAFQQVPGRVVGLRLVMCSPEEKYQAFLQRLKSVLSE